MLRERHPELSEVIRKAVASADYAPLLASDQLRNAQAWGAAFVGYEEAPITFAPTYKYDPGTDVYDTSEKRRPPAYCDRVLWRGPKKHAACTTYGRHELRAADHRPVSAALALSVAVPTSSPSLPPTTRSSRRGLGGLRRATTGSRPAGRTTLL